MSTRRSPGAQPRRLPRRVTDLVDRLRPARLRSNETRPLRRRVYELLDPTFQTAWDKVVHRALIGLVLVNVAAVVIGSVPAASEQYRPLFLAIELVSAAAFTLEYGLRLWSSVEHMPYAGRSGLATRLAWIRTPAAIIDLCAILPFYMVLFVETDLRVLVLVRLVQFFKLTRYSPGLASLLEVLYSERRALFATLLILGGLVLTTATFMYLAEHRAQPDRFGTIPDAMWWAVVTLTTVGYGDVVPITALGKVIAGLTAIMGLVLIALPVGIIATAFAEVIHRREFVVTWSMVAKVPLFAHLDAAAIAEVIGLLQSRNASRGEVVVRRGEQAHAMFFIVSGEVKVELHEDEHPRLKAGDFFGEAAILTGQARNATVRACEDTKLLVLQAHDLELLMDRAPAIGKLISEVAAKRMPGRGKKAGDSAPAGDAGD